ncbi:hypothetical protein FRC17_009730 [Serendipita sp. 399]|nr:hypothetical protein FRC17_009730 [Serendipita sp. 399]
MNTRAQKAKEQAMTTDKGEGASSSKAKALYPHEPTPVSVAPIMQSVNRKRRSTVVKEKGDGLYDRDQHPGLVRPVINPYSLGIAQRLPVDILGLITLDTSRMRWMAPLAISQVCRLWRIAALATPAAWACVQIDTYRLRGPEFMELWLSRCGALTCRLSFPPRGAVAALGAACSRAEVLKGLSIFHSTQVLTGSFPNLEELRVSGYCPGSLFRRTLYSPPGPNITSWDNNLPSLLQASRFPSLRVLHLHSPSNVVMTAMAQQGLPPLEELHVHATCSSWEDIASQCAASLVTLGIRYEISSISSARPRKLHSVTFPVLTSLSIVLGNLYEMEIEPESLTTFKTPSLRSYFEKQDIESFPSQSPIHQDTFNVTTAIFVHADRVDWTKLPHLTHMTVRAGYHFCRRLCDSLGDNARQAPSISEIQWVSSRSTSKQTKAIKKSLGKRRQVTGKAVIFQALPEYQYRAPKETYEECFTYLPGTCGWNNGDIFDEGSQWREAYLIREGYFDDEDDYTVWEEDDYFDERDASYPRGWRNSAGIDSDGLYGELW